MAKIRKVKITKWLGKSSKKMHKALKKKGWVDRKVAPAHKVKTILTYPIRPFLSRKYKNYLKYGDKLGKFENVMDFIKDHKGKILTGTALGAAALGTGIGLAKKGVLSGIALHRAKHPIDTMKKDISRGIGEGLARNSYKLRNQLANIAIV